MKHCTRSPELSIGFRPTRPFHCTRIWSFSVACSAQSPRSLRSVDSLSSLNVSGVSSHRFSCASARSSLRRIDPFSITTWCSTRRGILSLASSVDLGIASKNRTQLSDPSFAIRAVITGFVNVTLSVVHANCVSVAQLPLTATEARLASGFAALLSAMPLAFNRSVNGLNETSLTLSSRPVFLFQPIRRGGREHIRHQSRCGPE